MGYYIICTKSYKVDEIEVEKGDIDYYSSKRPLISTKWRKATQEEIKNYKRLKK